jgi:antitoxin component of RelBE/YafQ-DinJ toxin-antitoxin module
LAFRALGMDLATAITVFVRQAVRQKKIPFEFSLDAASSGHMTGLPVALDTNVLVSALLSPFGSPAKIMGCFWRRR